MSQIETDLKTSKVTPAYLAYETVRNFVASLHSTAMPDHIGKGLMPNLSGGTKSHMLAALRFLNLIETDGTPTEGMRRLVMSFGGDQWSSSLGDVLNAAYAPILDGLSVASTTDEKLLKAFKDKTSLDGSVLRRSVRFFIKAMRDAKVTLSPHLGKRRPRRFGSKPPSATKERDSNDTGAKSRETNNRLGAKLPDDMIEFPIPIGNQFGWIRVPKTITLNQFPMIKAVADVVEALAKQNSANGETK
jgi:Family of unknown function (DUF5343)